MPSSPDRPVMQALIARLPLDDIVASVERQLQDLPEYESFVAGGPDDHDRGGTAIGVHLRTFIRWLADGQVPTDEDRDLLRGLVGVRAAEGRSQEAGLAVYRRGLGLGWDAVFALADEHEKVALAGAVGTLIAWLDVVAATFAEVYAQHRDALVSQHERRSRTLMQRIVAGDDLEGVELRLAEILGFETSDVYTPFVASVIDGSVAQHADLATRLRSRRVLATTDGRLVIGLASTPIDWSGLGPDSRLRTVTGHPNRRSALRDVLDDLRFILRLPHLQDIPGPIDPDEHLPQLLLHRSPHLHASLDRRVFGALRTAGHAELVATLQVLARCGFERTASAEAIPVHRNTLAQRIVRIEHLTGLDVDDPADRGAIWLATTGGVVSREA